MSRSVNVFLMEYEKLPKMDSWQTYIGAYSHEEAVKQLYRRVGNNIHVYSSGIVCRLDDLSFEVRDSLFGQVGVKKKKADVVIPKELGAPEIPGQPEKEDLSWKSGRGRKPGNSVEKDII